MLKSALALKYSSAIPAMTAELQMPNNMNDLVPLGVKSQKTAALLQDVTGKTAKVNSHLEFAQNYSKLGGTYSR